MACFNGHGRRCVRWLSGVWFLLLLAGCVVIPVPPTPADARQVTRPAPAIETPLLPPRPTTSPTPSPTAVHTPTKTPTAEPSPTAPPTATPAALPSPAAEANSPLQEEAYCIWPGETLTAIAANAGVTVKAILAVNPRYTGGAGSTIHLPPGSLPPARWAERAPAVATSSDLPFGISGIYLGADNRAKRVALSFDIGFRPENKALMEALAARGIRATFFVLGAAVKRHPDMIADILNNSHELGNHSFTHDDMQYLTASQIRAELQNTEDAVQAAYPGATTKPYFRAPYGAINAAITRIVEGEGYQIIAWTVDSHDWQEGVTGDEIYERVTRLVCPGAIIAMHDANPANQAALPRLLDFLEQNGYTFATVSELLTPNR